MIALVLVSYKNSCQVRKYLDANRNFFPSQSKIIIVDNESSPQSVAEIVDGLSCFVVGKNDVVKINEHSLFVLPSDTNLGFARANNLAAEFVMNNFKCKYIVFSNTDIQLQADSAITQMVSTLEINNSIGIIGPNVIGIDGVRQSPHPYQNFVNRYILMFWITPFVSAAFKRRLFQLNYSDTAQEGFHYRVMGSFFACRIDDYFNCGMMDSNTFLYAEEMILSERMSRIGKHTYFMPHATVIHEHGTTISKYFNQVRQQLLRFESESYYYQKYRGVSRFTIQIGYISIRLYLFMKRFL